MVGHRDSERGKTNHSAHRGEVKRHVAEIFRKSLQDTLKSLLDTERAISARQGVTSVMLVVSVTGRNIIRRVCRQLRGK